MLFENGIFPVLVACLTMYHWCNVILVSNMHALNKFCGANNASDVGNDWNCWFVLYVLDLRLVGCDMAGA